MLKVNTPRSVWDVILPDESATERLAMDIAVVLEPGDLVTLSGDLGAGKTTLARALIRYLASDPTLDVPSPTFTLIQTYELPRFAVVHTDLYRVQTLAELAELGWDEAEKAAVLVEWPDRAMALIQSDRLDVMLEIAADMGPTVRRVRLTGYGAWLTRLERLRAARALIDSSGFAAARRQRIKGDASTRSYERLDLSGSTAILMDAPPRTDLVPVKNGLPYHAVARLADNMRPYVAVARYLRSHNLSAPEIIAADIDSGLILMEDLGTTEIVAGSPPAPIEERYGVAIDVLVTLQTLTTPPKLPVAPRLEYELPIYDTDVFLIELELLLDWYLPARGRKLPPDARMEFARLWREVLEPMSHGARTLVLRDYHSPNLLWLPQRRGAARMGILDFQDALLGPAAYDVASLLMDARVDVSETLELALLSHYAVRRRGREPTFDPIAFAEQYVVLGAQRLTRILGVFARLNARDGKPEYLRHMPRVWDYLMRTFDHPALAELRRWYELNVPPPGGTGR